MSDAPERIVSTDMAPDIANWSVQLVKFGFTPKQAVDAVIAVVKEVDLYVIKPGEKPLV